MNFTNKIGSHPGSKAWNRTPKNKESKIIKDYLKGINIENIKKQHFTTETTVYHILKRNEIELRGHSNRIVLCPSCSEAVFRLNLKEYNKHKKAIDQIVKNQMLSFKPVPSYSKQRPRKGEKCIYAYQLSGNKKLMDFLLEKDFDFELYDNLGGYCIEGHKILEDD